MRQALLILVAGAALAGCGGDDEPDTVTVIERTVTEAAPASTPTATVDEPVPSTEPEPEAPLVEACPTRGLDAPGVTALSAQGVACSEAESVLLNWLQGCGGKDGPCEPVPGYTCEQERFAGARSDVICGSGAATVKFSFG
jgi:hypothetical protein